MGVKRIRRTLGIMTLALAVGMATVAPSLADTKAIDFNKTVYWTSKDIVKTLETLQKKYPELLELERIGTSVAGKPIMALRMTADQTGYRLNGMHLRTLRKHIFIEAGTHARETINPAILVKMVEDYCKDYADEKHLPDQDMGKILEGHVLHFVVLTNPDGFDLVKADWKKESDKKSNLRGVDLNRNYPSVYFDSKAKRFLSISDTIDKKKLPKAAKAPGKAFYPGKSPLTEPETKAVASYIGAYPFQGFISFHSQGQVVYHARRGMDETYNKLTEKIAGALAKKAGYKVMSAEDEVPTYGYLADFAAFETHKPAFTIETMSVVSMDKKYYKEDEYNKVRLLPLVLVKELAATAYGEHRLYKDGYFLKDFGSKEVADAFAKRLGATVVKGDGVPTYSIYENDRLVTVERIAREWPELAAALTQKRQEAGVRGLKAPLTVAELMEVVTALSLKAQPEAQSSAQSSTQPLTQPSETVSQVDSTDTLTEPSALADIGYKSYDPGLYVTEGMLFKLIE